MSTKQVTCRYFIHGICREGGQCLFSHDLANSKPSSISNYHQEGYCAYRARCRYDHTKPPAAAGGAVGPAPHPSPSSDLHSPCPSPDIAISVMRTHSNEPGKRETTTLVLRDRNLTGLAEDKTPPSPVNNPGGCSDSQTSPEMKPHSYLDAIRTGLDDLEACSSYSNEQQLRPYAAAGECGFGDACVYLHRNLCEICGLQVLHPFDPERRKAHKKVCMSMFEHEMEKAFFAFQASQDKVCRICMKVILEKASASERRSVILSNHSHTYCLSCIHQWRCAKQFENPIIKVFFKVPLDIRVGNSKCVLGRRLE